MNYVTSFIAVFSASSIFIGALFVLCPNGSMSKSVRYALSLVFLITVISAGGITLKKEQFDLNVQSRSELKFDNLSSLNAKLICEEALRLEKINFKEIEIYTNIADNYSIDIKRIVVFSLDDPEKIKSILYNISNTAKVEINEY